MSGARVGEVTLRHSGQGKILEVTSPQVNGVRRLTGPFAFAASQ